MLLTDKLKIELSLHNLTLFSWESLNICLAYQLTFPLRFISAFFLSHRFSSSPVASTSLNIYRDGRKYPFPDFWLFSFLYENLFGSSSSSVSGSDSGSSSSFETLSSFECDPDVRSSRRWCGLGGDCVLSKPCACCFVPVWFHFLALTGEDVEYIWQTVWLNDLLCGYTWDKEYPDSLHRRTNWYNLWYRNLLIETAMLDSSAHEYFCWMIAYSHWSTRNALWGMFEYQISSQSTFVKACRNHIGIRSTWKSKLMVRNSFCQFFHL